MYRRQPSTPQGRQGSFLVVRCDEDIARELYFGQERCHYYVGERAFQVVAASATFNFMASVVCLANCTWNLQASIGLSYIILNGLYWIAALIPTRLQWDLSAYVLDEKDMFTTSSYTDALVKVLQVTSETAWVRRGGAVPETEAWDNWLKEAAEKVTDPKWNGQECLTRLMSDAPRTTVGVLELWEEGRTDNGIGVSARVLGAVASTYSSKHG